MHTDTAIANDAVLIVMDDGAQEGDTEADAVLVDETPGVVAESAVPAQLELDDALFGILSGPKDALISWARDTLKLELDATRRLDFLRNQVRQAMRGNAAVKVKTAPSAKWLRNRHTGRVFEATDLLLRYGDGLDPCDADGNLL